MVGKADGDQRAIEAIREFGAVYLMALAARLIWCRRPSRRALLALRPWDGSDL